MSQEVLVTGAAGFIGSHVTEALLGRGDRVIGLDNLNDYYDPERKRANVRESSQAADADSYLFVQGDVRDRALVQAILSDHRIDSVVHLAAMAGVRASIDDPFLYYDVNLTGTMTLLESIVRERDGGDGAPNFVLASTSSVYGGTEVVPFVETDPCDRPLAPYPASKRAAELLGYTYHHLYGIDFSALRFFTVYGPRGRPDMMAYKVCDNLFRGRAVELYNRGEMYRDWTYVGDIAAGVVAACNRRLGYEIINLGRGEPVLLADFVQLIEASTGRKAHLQDAPMPAADIRYTYADISKARRLLGYEPSVSVAEGVARFMSWYAEAVTGADATAH